MQENEVVVSVKIDVPKVASRLNEVTTEIGKLKVEQKSLDQQIKETGDATGELTQQFAQNIESIKLLQSEQKALTGQLQASSDSTITLNASFRELDAQARALENEYKSLTAAQRESAAGQEMKRALIETKEQLKQFDAELGNHQRNVGNYGSAWESVVPGLGKIQSVLKPLGSSLQEVGAKGMAGFKSLGKSALEFGKTMITPPVGVITAILAAIVVVVQKVVEAFKKNDDAMTALKRAMSAFQPIVDALNAVFEALANVIAKVVEGIANMATSLIGVLFPAYKEAADGARDLIDAQDALEESERQYTENSARRNMEIARKRAEAANKEKYTAAQRMQILRDAMELEKKNLEEDKRIKAEQLRILEETARRERDTSDETKNKIAQARAAMYQAEQNYFVGVRNLQKQYNSAQTEIDNEQKRAAQEAKRQAEERAREAKAEQQRRAQEAKQRAQEAKQRAAEQKRAAEERRKTEQQYQDWLVQTQRETEDALLSIEQDGLQRKLTQIKLEGEREVENLRIKMNRLRNVDVEAREALQKLILAKEKETQDKMTALTIQENEKRAAKAREIEQAREDLGETNAQILAERRIARAQETQNRLLSLSEEEKNALYASQQEYDAAVLATDTELYNARIAAQQEYYERTQLAQQNDFERRKIAAQEDEVELAQIELEQAAAENEALINMDAEAKSRLFASQEAYEAAMIESNGRLVAAQKKATETMVKDAETKASAVMGALGALSNLLDQFGEENEAAAKASKALALGQIAVETGVALAKGITQAQSVPFPANIAAIATTVTTVLANIASAISTVKSAKFAHGGIVEGTSYTGDRVPIMADSGEMIINRKDQGELFKALTGQNTQHNLGIDYGKIAQAVSSLPAPVMVYSELRQFEEDVTTYQEIASV